jgi:L-lactate dehydrogenase complex protein LldG
MAVAPMTTAREAILDAVRRQAELPAPPRYVPSHAEDKVATFVAKAKASYAQLHEAQSRGDVPEAVFALLAAAGSGLKLCLPKESELHGLPWHRAPALQLSGGPPGSEDSAIAEADYALAETGTLVFFAGPARPSAWHFLPLREIVLLRRERIVVNLEAMLSALPTQNRLPSTVNLVTGPSRTGDIEQTMERGAHGPRYVDIILVG